MSSEKDLPAALAAAIAAARLRTCRCGHAQTRHQPICTRCFCENFRPKVASR